MRRADPDFRLRLFQIRMVLPVVQYVAILLGATPPAATLIFERDRTQNRQPLLLIAL
jgi:hypothetical protein